MLKWHFEVNGKTVSADEFPTAFGDAAYNFFTQNAINHIRSVVEAKIGGLECSEHHQPPNMVIVTDKSSEQIKLQYHTCCEVFRDQIQQILSK